MKTKEILKEWKNFIIKEHNASRVEAMIDDLADYQCKIIINDMGDSVEILYGKDKDSKYGSYSNQGGHKLSGSIRCMSSKKMFSKKAAPGGSLQGIGYNEKLGKYEENPVWYITLTSDTTRGMGPLLYEVLIEYITDRKNAALKPDARSISDAARHVWSTFDQRSEITKIQLDVDDKTVKQNKNYSIEITQLTKDIKHDDTYQDTAIRHKGPIDWAQSPLSRAYRKEYQQLRIALGKREPSLIIEPDAPKPPKVFISKKGSASSRFTSKT